VQLDIIVSQKIQTEKPGLGAAQNRFFSFEKHPGYLVFRFSVSAKSG